MTTEPTGAMIEAGEAARRSWGKRNGNVPLCAVIYLAMEAARIPDTHRASSDEVEAVARALCNADGLDPDLDFSGPNERWEPNWHEYRDFARVALTKWRRFCKRR